MYWCVVIYFILLVEINGFIFFKLFFDHLTITTIMISVINY